MKIMVFIIFATILALTYGQEVGRIKQNNCVPFCEKCRIYGEKDWDENK